MELISFFHTSAHVLVEQKVKGYEVNDKIIAVDQTE